MSAYRLFLAIIVVLAVSINAYRPTPAKISMKLDLSPASLTKALGIAAIGLSLSGVAHADGAYSASTKYRARIGYGSKIYALKDADVAAFDKKAAGEFDLFISQSNSPVSIKDKAIKATELKLKNDIFAAAAAKDSGKLKASLAEFIKVSIPLGSFKHRQNSNLE